MLPIHTSEELRAADEAAIAGGRTRGPRRPCRFRGCGQGASEAPRRHLRQKVSSSSPAGSHNGDDGRVARPYWLRRRQGGRARPTALPHVLPGCDLVIDAAYGTGFRGEYRAPQVPATTPVLAIDIPSGVDCDTGSACEGAVRASVTVTMAALKPGLLMGKGRALSGTVEVAPIGIAVAPGKLFLVEDADIAGWLEPRPEETNKWRSACAVVAGSPGMLGAGHFPPPRRPAPGAGMVRWLVPGANPDTLPASEAVARSLPWVSSPPRC